MEYIFSEIKKLLPNIYILLKKIGGLMNNYVKNSENSNEVTKMKRLIAVTGLLLFLCLCISAAVGSRPIKADTAFPQPSAALESSATEPEDSRQSGYLLKEYDKRVAVFENGGSVPIFISSTYLAQLPEEDRRLLRAGIIVPDRKTLRRLLEDYCS